MEQEENYRRSAFDFISFMYQKGFRGKYKLLQPGTNHPGITADLSACLNIFLTGYDLSEKASDRLQLDTYADQGSRLNCTFQVRFDEVKGFQIEQMMIKNTQSNETRQYHIANNHQIPGSVAVQGLFPKPKPWDNIIKGKFRP